MFLFQATFFVLDFDYGTPRTLPVYATIIKFEDIETQPHISSAKEHVFPNVSHR